MSDTTETIEFRETTQPLLPEGWYVNEADTDTLRWWTGNSWSDQVKPLPVEEEVTSQVAFDAPWSTLSVWAIASSPYLAAVALVLAAALFNASGFTAQVVAVLAVPYVWTLLFAPLDELRLRRWGYAQTANWAWVLLTAPAYLIARTVVLYKSARVGTGVLWMWVINALVVALALGGFLLMSMPAMTFEEIIGVFTYSALGLPQP